MQCLYVGTLVGMLKDQRCTFILLSGLVVVSAERLGGCGGYIAIR